MVLSQFCDDLPYLKATEMVLKEVKLYHMANGLESSQFCTKSSISSKWSWKKLFVGAEFLPDNGLGWSLYPVGC